MNSVHTINLKKKKKVLKASLLTSCTSPLLPASHNPEPKGWTRSWVSIFHQAALMYLQIPWAAPGSAEGALMAPADGFSPHATAQIRAQMAGHISSSSCPPQQTSPFPSFLSPPTCPSSAAPCTYWNKFMTLILACPWTAKRPTSKILFWFQEIVQFPAVSHFPAPGVITEYRIIYLGKGL